MIARERGRCAPSAERGSRCRAAQRDARATRGPHGQQRDPRAGAGEPAADPHERDRAHHQRGAAAVSSSTSPSAGRCATARGAGCGRLGFARSRLGRRRRSPARRRRRGRGGGGVAAAAATARGRGGRDRASRRRLRTVSITRRRCRDRRSPPCRSSRSRPPIASQASALARGPSQRHHQVAVGVGRRATRAARRAASGRPAGCPRRSGPRDARRRADAAGGARSREIARASSAAIAARARPA